jgi:hypothetical protein
MKKLDFVIKLTLAITFLGGTSLFLLHVKDDKVSLNQQESTELNQFNGIPISEVFSDSKTYDIPEQLEADADVILIGKPIADISESKIQSKQVPFGSKRQPVPGLDNYASGGSYTTTTEDGAISSYINIVTIKVQKVIKGDIKSKTIDVVEPAALVQASDNSRYIIASESYTPLQKNKKYILFLVSTDTMATKYADIYQRNGYKNELPGKYITISPGFSKFNLDSSDQSEAQEVNKDVLLKPFKEKVSKKYLKEYNAATE